MKWVTDHCGCVLNINWNTSLQTYDFVSADFLCPNHSSLSLPLPTVIEENKRKNDTFGIALTNLMAQIGTTDPVSGAPVLKNGISYVFSFSGTPPNRVLNISFTGITITAAQKSAVQSKLDTRFGAGKVVIN